MVTVTIAGRPNVGKSTLFNVLAGKRIAITDHKAGTTRDLVDAQTDLYDSEGRHLRVRLIDSGGMGIIDEHGIAAKVEATIKESIEAADVIVFVLDARTGITDLDQTAANKLRRTGKPVVVATNKCETTDWEIEAQVFGKLGFGEPIPIAAQERKNLRPLILAIVEAIKTTNPEVQFIEENETEESDIQRQDDEKPFKDRAPGPMRIAVLGRRNVGKSTFVNSLIGQERCIVSEIPGTTRDAIDIQFEFYGNPMVIIDTAGIVRKREGSNTIEFKSTVRTEKAIKRADVVVLLIDCQTKLGKLEKNAFHIAQEFYKPTIIAVNKWDLSTIEPKEFMRYLEDKLAFAGDLPVAFVSAINNAGVRKVITTTIELFKLSGTRLTTPHLNRLVKRCATENILPSSGTKTAKIYYAVQAGTYPPEFIFFVNEPDLFGDPYTKYLKRKIAEEIGSSEVPVKLIFKGRDGRNSRHRK